MADKKNDGARLEEIPNETTMAALREAEDDENLFGPYDTIEELMTALQAD